ncbi:MAG: hypothetical protein DDT23_00823 [candidate division WS2 bacterium]|nr:hypothetical protein [Candidatus Lithacetigena glycinireducens]
MLFDLYEPVSKQKQNGKKITGYTIYDAEQKRRTKRNDLPEFYPDLPQKKYSIIYCDPPWDYNGKLQFDKSSKDVDSINLDKPIFISAANFKYPTIKTDVLKKYLFMKYPKMIVYCLCG